ncbi:MAG: MFS transporter [Chloroflexi bacterium]|nr:MFS transporter [Chloroflexota bacterium]
MKKVFFGWWIVAAGFGAMVVHGGGYTYGLKVFFLPLIEEFGWGRAALSGAFSLAQLESGILGPIEGVLIDRLGPRKVMLLGMFLFGLGFILISRIDSLLGFYLVFIFLLSIGDSFATTAAVSTAVANWFFRQRSRAMGLVMAGIGVGGVSVPFFAWLVAQQGWRFTAVVIGLGIWALGMPLASVMRHKPEQYGYLPDGEKGAERREERNGAGGRGAFIIHHLSSIIGRKRPAAELDLTAREALRTRSFWLLSIAFAIRLAVTVGVTLHLIPYLSGLGASPEGAALALSMLGLTSVLGRVGFGVLGDLFPIRYVVASSLALIGMGAFILAGLQELWQVIPFLLVFAPAYGGQVSLMPALRGEYFGRRAFATIQGFMGLVLAVGTVTGPVFAGYLYDVLGSYRQAFVVFGVAAAIAALLAVMAKRPRQAIAD